MKPARARAQPKIGILNRLTLAMNRIGCGIAAARELLRAADQVLEALTGADARNGGLLDPNPLARLGVTGVPGRAVDLLEREGLVKRQQGRGTFVNDTVNDKRWLTLQYKIVDTQLADAP